MSQTTEPQSPQQDVPRTTAARIAAFEERRTAAHTGNERSVANQRAKGKHTARERIAHLPGGARDGVAAAVALYAELAAEIRASDPDTLDTTRIRVSGPRKALVTAKAVARVRRRSS